MNMHHSVPLLPVPGTRIRNAMTCDVEDYFQVSAFAPYIARDSWPGRECRVEANVERILALFEKNGVKATFFTLGWIAERYPALVRRIVAGGHELASHGYGHLRASDQDRAEFDNDIRSSKALLEDLGGVEVRGYRAPSFSIGQGNLWALDALREAGYRYSSSIYPIAHDHYGMPDAPRFAFYPNGPDGLLEVPITTLRLGQRNLPAGGGGYFRLLPYALSRWMIERVNRTDARSALFYFHPWELDPGQPRPDGLGAKARFRHYINIGRMERRLDALTRDFAWDRMDRLFLDQP
jgi:polysaccharide deacetylase family protein (PEP-CTERM system associated)